MDNIIQKETKTYTTTQTFYPNQATNVTTATTNFAFGQNKLNTDNIGMNQQQYM